MLKNAEKLSEVVITEISKKIGEEFTNSQIDECLKQCRLSSVGAPSTKWRKLQFIFRKYQDRSKKPNDIIKVLEKLLTPARYINDQVKFDNIRLDINKLLSIDGYEINASGTVIRTTKSQTIYEANARSSSLINKLQNINIHPKVLQYCTEELLVENYFHSVFEAAKSLSDTVREMTGLTEDGSKLYDEVFSISKPKLKFNDLMTESEKNQQNGLKEMLHGITHYVRNVAAHEPKIKWIIDESAAIEILSVISFLHSELDKCSKV